MRNDFLAVLLMLALIFFLTIIFFIDSTIDLKVSAYFYDPNLHKFPLAYDKVLRIIQKSVNEFVYIWTALLVFGLMILIFAKHLPTHTVKLVPLKKRQILFLALALLIGPGLIVNGLFKEGYGRARPAEIKEFGGDLTFSKPFVISPNKSQSFVSGHASAGFYAVALAFVVPIRKRKQTYLSGLLIGCIISTGRVLQGRHYLSDVIFSALITLIILHILSLLILQPEKSKQ